MTADALSKQNTDALHINANIFEQPSYTQNFASNRNDARESRVIAESTAQSIPNLRETRVQSTLVPPIQIPNLPRPSLRITQHTPLTGDTTPHIISQEEGDAAPEPLPDRRRRSPPTRIPFEVDDITFPRRPQPTDPIPLPLTTRRDAQPHRYNLRSTTRNERATATVSMGNAVIDSKSGAELNYHQLSIGTRCKKLG